jgi:hypothetical protein
MSGKIAGMSAIHGFFELFLMKNEKMNEDYYKSVVLPQFHDGSRVGGVIVTTSFEDDEYTDIFATRFNIIDYNQLVCYQLANFYDKKKKSNHAMFYEPLRITPATESRVASVNGANNTMDKWIDAHDLRYRYKRGKQRMNVDVLLTLCLENQAHYTRMKHGDLNVQSQIDRLTFFIFIKFDGDRLARRLHNYIIGFGDDWQRSSEAQLKQSIEEMKPLHLKGNRPDRPISDDKMLRATPSAVHKALGISSVRGHISEFATGQKKAGGSRKKRTKSRRRKRGTS